MIFNNRVWATHTKNLFMLLVFCHRPQRLLGYENPENSETKILIETL